MAYLTRKFTWDESHDAGTRGWMPDSAAHNELFMGSEGLGVAHDTLEHFSCDGSIEDELLAFGAIYFGRLELDRLNDFNPRGVRRSPEAVIAMDLAEVFCDNNFRDIKARRRGYSLEAEFLVDSKERMWAAFVDHVESRDRGDGHVLEVSEERTEQDVKDFRRYMRAWFDTAFAWIHSGYCRSIKRWNGPWPMDVWSKKCEATDLFWQLANEVQEITGKLDWEEGDTMVVHVNVKRRGYSIHTSRDRELNS